MNKQITSFTLLLIALIIGGYFFFTSSDDSLSSKEARNFALKGDSEINKIFLANKTGAKVILTKEGEIWRVNGQYVARNFRIQALLKTAREIQVKQRVPKAQQERILKNLATNNIKVEFYTNDELIKSYFIGSADGTTTGTYMLLID